MNINRYDNLLAIEKLDPLQDHCQIYHLMIGYEFPYRHDAIALMLL